MLSLTLILAIPAMADWPHPHHHHNHGHGGDHPDECVDEDVNEGEVLATNPAARRRPETAVADYDREWWYVAGPAAPFQDYRYVLVYDEDWNLLHDIEIMPGQGVPGAKYGSDGGLGSDGAFYVNTDLGTVRVSYNDCTGEFDQSIYAGPYDNLDPEHAPFMLANGLAFGPDGEMYIGSSLDASIRYVPPGGGASWPWFVDFANLFVTGEGQFGPNAPRLNPLRTHVYFSDTGGPSPVDHQTGQPIGLDLPGAIYRLPRVLSPQPGDLQLVYEYGVTDQPDGITFLEDEWDENGDRVEHLLVVLAGTNAISHLEIRNGVGTEVWRRGSPDGASIGYIQPSTIAVPPRPNECHYDNDEPTVAVVNNHALYADLPTPFGDLPLPDPSPYVQLSVNLGCSIFGDPLP